MESKNKQIKKHSVYRIVLFNMLLCILLHSCWLIESEPEIKDSLVGNFKMLDDPNAAHNGYSLVLDNGEGFFQIIQTNCKEIHFDSTNLYVKSLEVIDKDTSFKFHHIRIVSNATEKNNEKFSKKSISEEFYVTGVTQCNGCIVKKF